MFAGIGPDAEAIVISGVAIQATIQPWRLRDTQGATLLLDPVFGNALCEAEDGTVGVLPGDERPGAALMSLDPLPASELTAAMSDLLRTLGTVLPDNLNGPDILDVVANTLTRETADLVQAVIRLLPRDQIDWLGATLLGLPSHLARVSAAFPGDVWAVNALPTLREWLRTRRRSSTLRIPPELDFLAETGLNGQPSSLAHTLSAVARAHVPPRQPVCVVATARNEGLYLLEWVAYHRLIGANALFIYSNDNSDGSDDLLRSLALAGEITWVENQLNAGRGAQPKAYGHAFGILPDVLDFRWSLVIDLDEFFAFDTGHFRSMPDYIDWQETQRVDAISLNWLVFGSAGASGWSSAPMVERFNKRLPWIDPHIKSLSRTNLCLQSHPHHASFMAQSPIITRDSEGQPYQFKDGFSFSAKPQSNLAWVSHYFLKSAEEFIWKFSRNRGDHALVRDLDPALIDPGFASMFLQQHQSPTMVDDRRTVQCAPDLRGEINRMRGLPGVQAAEERILAGYRKQVECLIASLRTTAGAVTGDSPFPQLALLCG